MAFQCHHTEDLTRKEIKADACHLRRNRQVSRANPWCAFLSTRIVCNFPFAQIDLLTEHQLDHTFLYARLNSEIADRLAVTEHRGRVAKLRDLAEPVRDVNYSHSFVGFLANHRKHALNQIRRKRCCHFVEKKNVRL